MPSFWALGRHSSDNEPHSNDKAPNASEEITTAASKSTGVSEQLKPLMSKIPADKPLTATTSPAPAPLDDAPGGLTAPFPEPTKQHRRISLQTFGLFKHSSKPKPPTQAGSEQDPSTSPKSMKNKHHHRLASKKVKKTTESEHNGSPAGNEHVIGVRSALVVKDMLLGPNAPLSNAPSFSNNIEHQKSPKLIGKSIATPPISQVHAELVEMTAANHIIASLRQLPPPDGPVPPGAFPSSSSSQIFISTTTGVPVHGVCLDCSDEEAETKIFSQLNSSIPPIPSHESGNPTSSATLQPPPNNAATSNITTTNIHSLLALFNVKLIHLVTPDSTDPHPTSPASNLKSQIEPPHAIESPFAGDEAVLLGAIPTPGAIVDGVNEAARQVLALGLGGGDSSSSFFPDHEGVHPPLDRISCVTYWWGYELILPESSIKYLSRAKSISNALLNILTVFALLNGGVREILPFIRYASQFVDFEWKLILAQDKGEGVICAATWILPTALIPRPWDFAPKPPAPSPPPTPAPVQLEIKDGGENDDAAVDGTEVPSVTITHPTLPRRLENTKIGEEMLLKTQA